MSMIKIITDAGFDLPDELIKKYNIHVLGNWVIKKTDEGDVEIPDEKKYLDETLQSIKNGEEIKTAAISIGHFKEVFEDLTNDGSSLIYISFSSKKTRIYYNALAAKKELPDRDIRVIDSMGGVGMQSFVVLSAAKVVKEGKEVKEVLRIISDKIKNAGVLISIPNISFFARMGRLPKGKDLKSSALKLITLIGFVRSDGELVILGRYRTYKLVNAAMIKFIENELKKRNKNEANCIVSSLGNEKTIAELKEELNKKEWCNRIMNGEIYPEHAVFLGLNACTLGYEFI